MGKEQAVAGSGKMKMAVAVNLPDGHERTLYKCPKDIVWLIAKDLCSLVPLLLMAAVVHGAEPDVKARIVGKWVAMDGGDKIIYDFRADESVVISADSPEQALSLTGKYRIDDTFSPTHLDIFDLSNSRLKDHVMAVIVRFDGENRMLLDGGPPTRIDAATMPKRPQDFTSKAGLFTRVASSPQSKHSDAPQTVPQGISPLKGIRLISVKDSTGKSMNLYERSYALLVGVSKYTEGWPSLPSIPDEMDLVEAALQTNGFTTVKVINPNSTQLKKAFEEFIAEYGYKKNNRLLFYFSGHGWSRKGGEHGYLVPTDAPDPRRNEEEFLRRSLNMTRILAWCKEMEAKHAIFLFDSCFSGTIFKTKALPETPPHITSLTAKPVRQFITAGDAGEQVPAKSVFVACFLRGLSGEADLSKDGYITGTELGMYLHDKVIYYKTGQTPQYGKMRDPELDEGDFVFEVGAIVVVAEPASIAPSAPLSSVQEIVRPVEGRQNAVKWPVTAAPSIAAKLGERRAALSEISALTLLDKAAKDSGVLLTRRKVQNQNGSSALSVEVSDWGAPTGCINRLMQSLEVEHGASIARVTIKRVAGANEERGGFVVEYPVGDNPDSSGTTTPKRMSSMSRILNLYYKDATELGLHTTSLVLVSTANADKSGWAVTCRANNESPSTESVYAFKDVMDKHRETKRQHLIGPVLRDGTYQSETVIEFYVGNDGVRSE